MPSTWTSSPWGRTGGSPHASGESRFVTADRGGRSRGGGIVHGRCRGARRSVGGGRPGQSLTRLGWTRHGQPHGEGGSDPRSPWNHGAPQALDTTFRGGRSLPRLTHGTRAVQAVNGFAWGADGRNPAANCAAWTRTSENSPVIPEVEAEAQAEATNRILSRLPSRGDEQFVRDQTTRSDDLDRGVGRA
jgi:hypothetical protein